MARAHRIGQTRPVRIFRLVSQGTVEETILERAKRKMVLDHLVIQRMQQNQSRTVTFDRQELQTILQFGAQSLFASNEESNDTAQADGMQFDLDELLQSNEAPDAIPSTDEPTSEFLGQFQVASFTISQKPEVPETSEPKSWENIIPDELISKAQEEAMETERMKKEIEVQAALLTAAKKRRNKTSASADQLDLPPESSKVEVKKKNLKKTAGPIESDLPLLNLDKTNTKSVVLALLKYGDGRMDRISYDCSDVSKEAMDETIKNICSVAMTDMESKGVTFSNGFYLSVAQLRDRIKCLSGLKNLLDGVPGDKLLSWRIVDSSRRIKSVALSGAHRWAIDSWSIVDDSMLLVGVWMYGFGEWQVILEDQNLCLGKLSESFNNSDPKILPKALHLGRRVEYLVHCLEKQPVEKKEAEKTRIKDKKVKVSEKHEEPAKGNMKHFFKPVRSQLTFLASLTADEVSSRLSEVCKAVLAIGRHIDDPHKDNDCVLLDHWKWVTSVWPSEISSQELFNLYKKIRDPS